MYWQLHELVGYICPRAPSHHKGGQLGTLVANAVASGLILVHGSRLSDFDTHLALESLEVYSLPCCATKEVDISAPPFILYCGI